MSPVVLDIRPAPSDAEAAAIAMAVRVLLESARDAAGTDPRPPAYRSPWRQTAMQEGVGRSPDARGLR